MTQGITARQPLCLTCGDTHTFAMFHGHHLLLAYVAFSRVNHHMLFLMIATNTIHDTAKCVKKQNNNRTLTPSHFVCCFLATTRIGKSCIITCRKGFFYVIEHNMARRRTQKKEDNGLLVVVGIGLLALFAYSWYQQANWLERGAAAVFYTTLLILLWLLYSKLTANHAKQQLMDLSGSEFEQRVVLLLEDMGWQDVRCTGGSGDGGIDITAKRDDQAWVVQCKRYKKPVPPTAVRDLIGAATIARADRALLVTTSRFTEQGKAHAKGRVLLWDGETVATYIEQVERRRRTPKVRRIILYGSLVVINNFMLVWLLAEPIFSRSIMANL
jgi:HJR/Mrr/RecB family endonuclease